MEMGIKFNDVDLTEFSLNELQQLRHKVEDKISEWGTQEGKQYRIM